MVNLHQYPAKICLTTAAVLIHQDKVLLIKHKKLSMWLNPGGHVEANELPHLAAEREFWEETGIKVRAVDWQQLKDPQSEFLPNPILTNLHWVSPKNYEARLADPEHYEHEGKWQRGCEQHINFLYLVEPVDGVNFQQNLQETTGIEWFDLDKIEEADLIPDMKTELKYAREVYQNYVKNFK